jgi:hypothetical protein
MRKHLISEFNLAKDALKVSKSMVVVRTTDLGYFNDDGNFASTSRWQRFCEAWARMGSFTGK